ncbi:hypothetical protein [Pelagibacterium luteolum]|uniref:Flagellin FlgL n=1 Tax=Pelagibacterium luteolum TaxID=440168 RepID=A0A1G7UE56_9HYPH|nr:hypothetical protein [Pelagibacterium luteolum]SDG45618.1 Flagellin FlgL [Pelagibacterium luteolum]
MIINKSMYPVSRDLSAITQMQKQFESLQLQLATGKRYNTLAEMGGDRVHELNIRARLTRIEGFQSNILTVENRMSFYTNGLERLDQIEADARALAVPGAYGTDGINFANSRNQATNLLKEVIDVLNTDITGQFIFGGNKSDTKPVSSFEEIMNGPNGFRQFVADRNVLDGATSSVPGVAPTGNVTATATGSQVVLGEADNPDAGIKLTSVAVNPPGSISVVPTPADVSDPDAPVGASYAMTVDAQPSPGDTVTIGITYPHDRDTIKYVTLKAVAGDTDPLPAGSFRIGDTPESTAANLGAAVTGKFETLAATELKSSSAYAAADRFFNATGEAQDPNAAAWYKGQDSTNPRQTVTANVDENTKAHYGVQANEKGFVELIKGLAVFAVSDDLSALDTTNAARYDAMVDIQRARLSESNNSKPGSIELITMELGLASSTINTVKQRHTQYNAQLQTMLSDIATAPREEIAMMLLTLQTQLQASYQATAMASQLSLVNYL